MKRLLLIIAALFISFNTFGQEITIDGNAHGGCHIYTGKTNTKTAHKGALPFKNLQNW